MSTYTYERICRQYSGSLSSGTHPPNGGGSRRNGNNGGQRDEICNPD